MITWWSNVWFEWWVKEIVDSILQKRWVLTYSVFPWHEYLNIMVEDSTQFNSLMCMRSLYKCYFICQVHARLLANTYRVCRNNLAKHLCYSTICDTSGDTINCITCIWYSNECIIWRHNILSWLLLTTQKRVLFFNAKDILGLKDGVECLCKVFSVCIPNSKR